MDRKGQIFLVQLDFQELDSSINWQLWAFMGFQVSTYSKITSALGKLKLNLELIVLGFCIQFANLPEPMVQEYRKRLRF